MVSIQSIKGITQVTYNRHGLPEWIYFDDGHATLDPLCEKHPDISPYVYCSANPIMRIDPDGRFDFLNIDEYKEYEVIAVFQKDYEKIYSTSEEIKAINDDISAAEKSGLPIIKVDNINDFANALGELESMGSYSSGYTLNSHGTPGHFKIGSDDIMSETDVSVLREGLEGTTVFIGACNSGFGKDGSKLITSFSKATSSVVIGSCHSIQAGYEYNGTTEKINLHQWDGKAIFNPTGGNAFKISTTSHSTTLIYNLTISQSDGFKWSPINIK